MNLLPGTVRGGEVQFDGGASLSLPAGHRAQEGQKVLYGIRPEHCALGGSGLPAEVVVVEPTGADTQLYCRCGGQDVTVTVRDRSDCVPGERIVLAPDPARAHLFDAESGRRLAA
jgi:multiple sugar transport system ATP-binding protein